MDANGGVFKLVNKPFSEKSENCLFSWAEQQYPQLFSPTLVNNQTFEDYDYRYYSDTNTYLGFFQDNKVHLLEPSKSGKIQDVGFMEFYQHLAGCGL